MHIKMFTESWEGRRLKGLTTEVKLIRSGSWSDMGEEEEGRVKSAENCQIWLARKQRSHFTGRELRGEAGKGDTFLGRCSFKWKRGTEIWIWNSRERSKGQRKRERCWCIRTSRNYKTTVIVNIYSLPIFYQILCKTPLHSHLQKPSVYRREDWSLESLSD